jgi:hypothetical protein
VDVEGVGDLSYGFPLVYEPAHQVYLLGVELLRTPQVNPPASSRLTAGTRAFADQVAFELGDPANMVMISLPA